MWRSTSSLEVLEPARLDAKLEVPRMKMSNWLRAGLIGAGVMVLLGILGILPCVTCFTWILALITYGCVGALAAYWMPSPRQPGPAAGHGALAGAIAAAIGGGVWLILLLGAAVVFVPVGILGDALEGTGVDPAALWETIFSVIGSITCGTGCYTLGIGIAAGLGALGGLICAAIQPE
jgi:hypothetical protein